MEEDIKTLENLIKFLNNNGNYIADENFEYEKIAIENLIKAYKELEEREIWSTATIQGLREDFIPKSVIKEKIENNKKVIDDTNDGDLIHRLLNEIDILQELLEEK